MRKKNPPTGFPLFLLMLFISFFLYSHSAFAQKYENAYDSSYRHKNNVKINITPLLIYNNALVFSYERSVAKRQTFAVTGGVIQLPTFVDLVGSNGFSKVNTNKSGYMLGGEYRFYLGKENKYAAPHGIYIGPYANYYSMHNTKSAIYTDSAGLQSSASLDTKLRVFNIGVELGYQFVVWDRLTIDFVLFAPSFSKYELDLALSGNIDPAHAAQINQAVLDAIKSHFPAIGSLIDEGSFHASGNLNSASSKWAAGFRYSLMLGYRFGK